jgi:nucleotide-binding universal stress UspA family protein
MLRTIIVPQETSSLADKTLAVAVEIARSAGARLLLVRASASVNKAMVSGAQSLIAAETRELAELARAADELSGRAERLRSMGVVAAARIGIGKPSEVIVDAARLTQADLIVMGANRRSRLERFLYPSVADEVLQQAPIPIVMVPSSWAGWTPSTSGRRILVPLDGSELAEQALMPAQALAAALAARIVLLRVVSSLDVLEANSVLENAASMVRARGQPADVRVVHGRDPGAAITGVARRDGIDLIAMSSRGHSGLKKLVMGSVARGTLQRATVPVVIIGRAVDAWPVWQKNAETAEAERARTRRAEPPYAVLSP